MDELRERLAHRSPRSPHVPLAAIARAERDQWCSSLKPRQCWKCCFVRPWRAGSANASLTASNPACVHLFDPEVVQISLRSYDRAELSSKRDLEALDDLADFPIVRNTHEPFLKRIRELRSNVAACEAVARPRISCLRS